MRGAAGLALAMTTTRTVPTTETYDIDEDDAIELAVDHLAADRLDGYALYFAHETRMHYLASDEDLADLGVRLHRGEPSAYSHWCVETTQDEVDVGAVVEQAGITTETDLGALAASTNDRVVRFACTFLRDAIAEELAEEGR